jgi:anti-sigma B factor antagonist
MRGPQHPHREPVGPVPGLVLHVVHEARQDAREPGIVTCFLPQRPQRDNQRVAACLDLQRHVSTVACLERAQCGELELVGPFVREIETRSDSSEHERDDRVESLVRGNGEHDPVVHESATSRGDDPIHSPAMSTTDDFDVTTERPRAGVAVIRVTGDLDLATASQVEGAISAALDASEVDIDLTSCTFIDSSGVRVLTKAARDVSASGGRIEVVADDPAIVRVLEITGVDATVGVRPSADA